MQIGIVKQGQIGHFVIVSLITCDLHHVDNLWITFAPRAIFKGIEGAVLKHAQVYY
jgi:hypothetical protein